MAEEYNTLPRENPQVEGFFTWSCAEDKARLRRLKASILAMFESRKGQPKHGRRRMSDVIELGVLFSSAEKEVSCMPLHVCAFSFLSPIVGMGGGGGAHEFAAVCVLSAR
jgi:hypothetical protein